MKHLIIRASLALVMLGAHWGAASAQSFTSGNWKGQPIIDKSGQFSRCAMSAKYNSGLTLMFDVDRSISWRMWLSNPKWNFTSKTTFDATIVVDQSALIPVRGEVIDKALVMIPLATTDHVVRNMRRGRLMQVVVGDAKMGFSLDGTNAAISQLVDCVYQATGQSRPSVAQPRPTNDFRILTAGNLRSY